MHILSHYNYVEYVKIAASFILDNHNISLAHISKWYYIKLLDFLQEDIKFA